MKREEKRLIYADALMKAWLEKPDPIMANEREKAIVAQLASQVIDAINEALIIDAEPVRRGKWIADRYCSECEWDKKEAAYTSGWRENFCPNCGVKMDEERNK